MHTFKASDGTVIIYNPDLSDVRINVDNNQIEDISYLTDLTSSAPASQVHVSGPALREFIAEYFRRQLISELEQIDIVKFLEGL